jgi:predicted  nucleic acid-binding Zn-ribbon protein
MSQVFTKLQEIESQIDGELKQIDRKMKELKQQRLKLTGLQKALKPRAVKPKRIVKVEGGTEQ